MQLFVEAIGLEPFIRHVIKIALGQLPKRLYRPKMLPNEKLITQRLPKITVLSDEVIKLSPKYASHII